MCLWSLMMVGVWYQSSDLIISNKKSHSRKIRSCSITTGTTEMYTFSMLFNNNKKLYSWYNYAEKAAFKYQTDTYWIVQTPLILGQCSMGWYTISYQWCHTLPAPTTPQHTTISCVFSLYRGSFNVCMPRPVLSTQCTVQRGKTQSKVLYHNLDIKGFRVNYLGTKCLTGIVIPNSSILWWQCELQYSTVHICRSPLSK